MPSPEPPRRAWHRRWQPWPRSLFGRLLLVLVAGMLLAQLLTGTIWHDMRYDQVNEMPARLAGVEIAQLLRKVEAGDPRPAITPRAGFQARRVPAPAPPTALAWRDQAIEQLLADTLTTQMGGTRALRLHQVALYDDDGAPARGDVLFRARQPEAAYRLDTADARGQWWQIDIRTGQAGLQLDPSRATRDYLLRIYGLRTGLILLLSLLVVHWLVRPLTRLGAAAEALGRDVNSPPLPVDGPREVRQTAEAFNRMQSRLLAEFNRREQLLAAVSHDLRSPLTRLRLRAERIQDLALRARVVGDIDHMQAITDSIFDYFSGQSRQSPPEPVDVDTLASAIAADMAESGADVTVQGRIGRPVPAWPASLKRAIGNLVENAVRYGARARVVLSVDGDMAQITIDDDGPGIPDTMLPEVRQPFVRLEGSRNAHTGGIGMGLGIADAVIAAHDGTLTLRNRPGPDGPIGLQACVRLPLDRVAAGGRRPIDPPGP